MFTICYPRTREMTVVGAAARCARRPLERLPLRQRPALRKQHRAPRRLK